MEVLEELKEYYCKWSGEKGYIGLSENGVPIAYFSVRKTDYPVILAQYSIHAREYITVYLALKQAEDFKKSGEFGTVYFIPAVNPDGIADAYCDGLYKANARRVDLNVNFDARWGGGEKNVTEPSSENYVGKAPFSEAETRALRDFTLTVRPDVTISYHSKGEEIYWEFYQSGKSRIRDGKIARVISRSTGYPLRSAGVSAGGYKDWCIEKLGIPSFTLEVGDDKLSHPVKKEDLPEIYAKNKRVFFDLTEYLWKEKNGL